MILRRPKNRPMEVIYFLLVSAGIALLPVYVAKSGGIQPAHLILASFAGFVLLRKGLPRDPWAILFLIFSGYVLTVEMYYSLDGFTYSYKGKTYLPIINGIFFFYSYLVSAALYIYCRRSGLAAVSIGVLCATTISLATVFISGIDLQAADAYVRSSGSFNNPNQLGFFSVCILSIAYLLYRQGTFGYMVSTVLFLAALFLSIASLSRAAIFANFVVFFLILQPKLSRATMLLWGVATILLGGLFLWFISSGAVDDLLFIQRFYDKGAALESTLEGRGYFAFAQGNLPQWLFGLGFQNAHRIVGHEVHSTVVSVLSNYGLVGLALFGAVLALWVKKLWRRFGAVGVVCIAGPAMLYGITHNGTRFTFFWVLFAASLAAASRRAAHAKLVSRSQFIEPYKQPI